MRKKIKLIEDDYYQRNQEAKAMWDDESFGIILLAGKIEGGSFGEMDSIKFLQPGIPFQVLLRSKIEELVEQGYNSFYICNPEYAYYAIPDWRKENGDESVDDKTNKRNSSKTN